MPMPTKHSSGPDSTLVILRNNRPGLLWAVFIFILSTVTPPPLEIPRLFDLFSPDKVIHFVFYCIQTVLFFSGFSKMTGGSWLQRNPAFHAFWISCCYGGLIELHQGFLLTNRTADPADAVANCIGAGIGLVVVKSGIYTRLLNLLPGRFQRQSSID